MMDDNLLNAPAASPDDLPASPTDGAADSKPLNLTPDQLDALGLADCAPGEGYTISIKCTGNDPENGPQFEAEGPAEPADSGEESDEAPAAPVDEAAPSGDEPSEAEGDEDSGSPFVKRKKKEPREGLPSTKNMRNI